jgi:tRNA1(Val) A37 N6-methylase TrmN6
MIEYEQPDFYRFNEDSLKLVKFVMQKKTTFKTLLDLGAGCGVIGLELGQKSGISDLTFLEAQSDFIPFLERNSKIFPEASIIHSSFGDWKPNRTFDCIVSNPPYFDPARGERSLDPRRDMARSFMKDNWGVFFSVINRCLTRDGKAFIVLRHNHQILEEVDQSKLASLKMEKYIEGNLIFLELSRLNVDRN